MLLDIKKLQTLQDEALRAFEAPNDVKIKLWEFKKLQRLPKRTFRSPRNSKSSFPSMIKIKLV